MLIESFFDSVTGTLTHVLFDERSRDAVVIDPLVDYNPETGQILTRSAERIAEFIDAQRLRLHWVLETHVHADHLSASQWLKERFGAGVAVSRRITEVQEVFKSVFQWSHFPADGRQFDKLLRDGEHLVAGTLEIVAIATPGHTPACMSFAVDDVVFTGDALFLDDVGVGRCDFPHGDAKTLFDSVTKRLFTLPPQTKLYVGHDYPPAARSWKAFTTVASAKRANVQLNASMTREEFVARRVARDATLSAPRLLYPSLRVNIAAGSLTVPDLHCPPPSPSTP